MGSKTSWVILGCSLLAQRAEVVVSMYNAEVSASKLQFSLIIMQSEMQSEKNKSVRSA